MTDADRFDAMKSELQYLRAEMDLNRKYIFERPLLILTGGITAAATLKGIHGFDVLPAVFSALIGFNLWFTFNRLQSNARIISYLQLVHTPDGAQRWVGWEAALRRFRAFPLQNPRAYDEINNLFRSKAEVSENRFYGPIMSFHVFVGLGLTAFLLAQVYPAGVRISSLPVAGAVALLADVAAVAGLGVVAWLCRPQKVRHTIAVTRDVWDRALPAAGPDPLVGENPDASPFRNHENQSA